MPVERLEDGTFRVGNVSFLTAEQAFDFDAKQRGAAPAPGPDIAAVKPQAPGQTRSQWQRMTRGSRVGALATGAVILLVVASAVMNASKSDQKVAAAPAAQPAAAPQAPAPAPVIAAAAAVDTAPAKAPPVPLPSRTAWEYESKTDQMTNKRSAEASLTSDNTLNLDFPYNGAQRGFLVVRRHPQYGLDVIVAISKGQILCNTYDCRISVKFDDGAPMKFGGSGPADHSSTSVFLEGPERFINLAKKAKKILVQINLFHNGSQVLEFSSPVPLEWPPT